MPVPLPKRLAMVSEKHRQYQQAGWLIYTPRYKPKDSLYGHLVFCLKYEGINLLFLKKLFEKIEEQVVENIIKNEPLSQYSRKIWFLYEWLMGVKLNVPDLKEGNYVTLVDDSLQYSINKGVNSKRHRIRNNLPGTVGFCPMINKTRKLENYIKEDLSFKAVGIVQGIHKDVLLRTSAFLLLKDSKASFNIEGETPTSTRASRWGKVIGQAGSQPISKDELLRLQQIVIENQRFTNMGFRIEGGFVGKHDRSTGEPLPDHISAHWQDLDLLVSGLLKADSFLDKSQFNPVLTAATIAFGFVFIHPFSDGNVLNNTVDYYRYFDATPHAEFLFDCVNDTIEKIIPDEVSYLTKYDEFKSWIDDTFEMPDKMVALLVRYLEQNSGSLSKRAREREFHALRSEELEHIEKQYALYFSQ